MLENIPACLKLIINAILFHDLSIPFPINAMFDFALFTIFLNHNIFKQTLYIICLLYARD